MCLCLSPAVSYLKHLETVRCHFYFICEKWIENKATQKQPKPIFFFIVLELVS